MAAAILVCRSSQPMLTQFTLMPVCLVNSSRSALGGDGYATATVIDPGELAAGLPPLDPHAAPSVTRLAASAMAPARLVRMRELFICLLFQRGASGPPSRGCGRHSHDTNS